MEASAGHVVLFVPAESCICVSKVALMLRSHALPDSTVTNRSLLPIFPLYLVSSGMDYTGLDNLPEADMLSFIKNPNADTHTFVM